MNLLLFDAIYLFLLLSCVVIQCHALSVIHDVLICLRLKNNRKSSSSSSCFNHHDSQHHSTSMIPNSNLGRQPSVSGSSIFELSQLFTISGSSIFELSQLFTISGTSIFEISRSVTIGSRPSMGSLKQCSFWLRNFSGKPATFWPHALAVTTHPLGRGVSNVTPSQKPSPNNV